MPQFSKESIKVEAFRLGQRGQPSPAPFWFGTPHPDQVTDHGIFVGAHGGKLACWGDWIILHEGGKLEVCGDEHFRENYKLINRSEVKTQESMDRPIQGPVSAKAEDELVEVDLTDELWREYDLGSCVYRIDLPKTLRHRKGGAIHRVLDSEGVTHLVPVLGEQLCILRWKKKDSDESDKLFFVGQEK